LNTVSTDNNAASQELAGIKRGPIVAALIIGAFVAILNETLLNIAFPDLMIEFGVSTATVQWLATVYMLVIGILVPVTALLQGWFTTRQMFLSAMLLFLAGTVLCGVAPAFEVLLIGRIIQALGTGLMFPVMMNTILVIFPPEKRGGAMGMIGLVIMFGPAIGPTLSGLIVDSLSWRWLFYLIVPLAVFSILFAAAFLKNVSDITRPKVDLMSILLSTVAFGGIVYGFSKAGDLSWSSPEVYGTVIAGAAALILFVWRQLVMDEPVLDMRTFKYPMFTIVTVLLLILMMTLFSTMIMLPLFMQSALLFTAFKAGLVLMPGGVINGIMAPVSGKLLAAGAGAAGPRADPARHLAVHRHYVRDDRRLHRHAAYRAARRHFPGDDARPDDGSEPASPPAVPARHRHHEHAAASGGRCRHGAVRLGAVERIEALYGDVRRPGLAGRRGQRPGRGHAGRVLGCVPHRTGRACTGLLRPEGAASGGGRGGAACLRGRQNGS